MNTEKDKECNRQALDFNIYFSHCGFSKIVKRCKYRYFRKMCRSTTMLTRSFTKKFKKIDEYIWPRLLCMESISFAFLWHPAIIMPRLSKIVGK